jgi:hypothetical protein
LRTDAERVSRKGAKAQGSRKFETSTLERGMSFARQSRNRFLIAKPSGFARRLRAEDRKFSIGIAFKAGKTGGVLQNVCEQRDGQNARGAATRRTPLAGQQGLAADHCDNGARYE